MHRTNWKSVISISWGTLHSIIESLITEAVLFINKQGMQQHWISSTFCEGCFALLLTKKDSYFDPC